MQIADLYELIGIRWRGTVENRWGIRVETGNGREGGRDKMKKVGRRTIVYKSGVVNR